MKCDKRLTKCIIPCRLSYLNCFSPVSVNQGEPKYSVSMIIPKGDTQTIAAINKAIDQAKKDFIPKWGGKIPKDLKMPLKDGDVERPEDEAYKGCYFLNANSSYSPQVVDTQVEPITDKSQIYSGCYGNVSVNFYGYNTNGSVGIAVGLGNIQLTRQGEPLGDRTTAKDEFAVIIEENFLS